MADGISGILGAFGAGAIGDAVVHLRLDNSQYQAGLAQSEAQLASTTKTAQSGFAKMGALGKAAFAGLGLAAAKFVADSIAAATESEAVLAQLRIAVGNNTAAYEEQATALQEVTGFQDELILSADTILARFDLTTEQIQRAIPVVLDYARATGKDVPAAASAVGKALLGNARALKEVGINFTATGNRTADFETILDGLQSKVSGSAAAFGNTFAGQQQKFSASVDDLQEDIGRALIPILNDTIETVGDVIDVFKVATDGIGAFSSALDGVLPDFDGIKSGLGEVGDALKTIFTESLPGVLQGAKGAFFNLTDALQITTEAGPRDREKAASDAAVAALGEISIGANDMADNVRHAIDEYGYHLKNGELVTREFARFTLDELADWRAGVIENIRGTFGTIQDFDGTWDVSKREFLRNTQEMLSHARRFQRDMERLADQDLSPRFDEFQKFLVENPAQLDAYVRLTGAKQRQAREQWLETQGVIGDTKRPLDDIIGLIDRVPNTKTMDIIVRYSYPGYDPSIPIPGVP